MRKITLGLALAAALTASEARAQGLTGNELHELCADPAAKGFCLGYVIAFGEFYMIAEVSWRTKIAGWAPSWCRPANATNQQLADIVTAFLRDHPEVTSWRSRWCSRRSSTRFHAERHCSIVDRPPLCCRRRGR